MQVAVHGQCVLVVQDLRHNWRGEEINKKLHNNKRHKKVYAVQEISNGDGRTERYARNERRIFGAVLPELIQENTVTVCSADCCSQSVMFSVLTNNIYCTNTVQNVNSETELYLQ